MGEAMLKIILVFAELERNMTSERVTATMISRANQGLWNGGRIPYGYSYDAETSAFSIIQDEADVCQLMKTDYFEHKSIIHTARLLNDKKIPTRSGALTIFLRYGKYCPVLLRRCLPVQPLQRN